MPRIPDYLIIGTMKGGTTALNDFICAHPDVGQAIKKEIHYFSLYPYKGQEWYLQHFSDGKGKIIGEASPTYFDVAYTEAIPQLIKKFSPSIKLILIVREPVSRAVSHFYHLRNINKVEQLQDIDINDFFSRPLNKVISRAHELDYYLHQVIDFSLYARKFMTYCNVFPSNSILVIGAWELRNNARDTMARVFEFLDLQEYYDANFETVKYSSGKDINVLDSSVRVSLAELLGEDFCKFCKISGLQPPGDV